MPIALITLKHGQQIIATNSAGDDQSPCLDGVDCSVWDSSDLSSNDSYLIQ